MKRLSRNLGIYLIIFVMILGAAYLYRGMDDENVPKEVEYSTFVEHLKGEQYYKINITDRKVTGYIEQKAKKTDEKDQAATQQSGKKMTTEEREKAEQEAKEAKDKAAKVEYTYVPSLLEVDWIEQTYIFPQLEKGGLEIESDPPESGFSWLAVIPNIIMIAALVALMYFMFSQGGNNKAFQFGKNRARLYKDTGKSIKYEDVAGLDEEKTELEEIVDFLKNPAKYTELGARIPKGVLLVGSPGTGKTYISKATAGEAGVPFFTISGSDFVEMFVGVGASRVRDLFDQAKKSAPCIIFIDEIDAVGRKRGAGLGGGNDEREQTLNQLLVEMDGFDENSGIIILAATNRPDVLDPALLRPGRFDRQVVIGMPDVKAREEIFRVHTRNKPLAEDVSPEVLAKRTPGFSPADIENLVNEAALLTARRNGTKIRMDEIEEATTKVIAGPQKKSRVISPEERKLTAYHEAGHAIVMRTLPESDPVHQITIIPRGMAGGFTMSLPEKDKFFETRGNMLDAIKHLLGGRVAEELKLDDISTGASNDLERATEIARNMITKYGFSEKFGPVSFSDSDEVFLGRDFSTRQNYSEATASEVDKEIRELLEECYAETKRILEENDDKLERVAQALLLVETLDGDQFEQLYNNEITPEDLEKAVRKEEADIARRNEEEAAARAKKEAEEAEQAEGVDDIADQLMNSISEREADDENNGPGLPEA